MCAIALGLKPLGEPLVESTLELEVFGKGLLVGPTAVITNRHVVHQLRAVAESRSISLSGFVLGFHHPTKFGLTRVFEIRQWTTVVTNPAVDIAAIEFGSGRFAGARKPVTIAPEPIIQIGQEVGIYGFAYGKRLFEREVSERREFYRFGPVL